MIFDIEASMAVHPPYNNIHIYGGPYDLLGYRQQYFHLQILVLVFQINTWHFVVHFCALSTSWELFSHADIFHGGYSIIPYYLLNIGEEKFQVYK